MNSNSIVLSNGKTLSLDKLGIKQAKSSIDILKSGTNVVSRLDKALIILIDLSGSMSEMFDRNTSKVEALWDCLKQKLAPNMSEWNYGVLAFQGNSAYWFIYPVKDTKALTVSSQPGAWDSTPMKLALDTAWTWVKTGAEQARFILITDGCPTDCTSEELLTVVGEHKNIPIDTIGIGSGSFGYDPDLLRQISALTGGMFSEVGSVGVLTDIIVKLSPAKRLLLGTVK